MNPADAADLLAIAATFDRRTVGEIEARAWAKALNGLDPRDCAQAIQQHYARTTDWLMPAHVRSEVRRIRDERLREAGNSDPEYDRDDVAGGIAAIRQHRKAIGDGQPIPAPPALPARPVRKLLESTVAALDGQR